MEGERERGSEREVREKVDRVESRIAFATKSLNLKSKHHIKIV